MVRAELNEKVQVVERPSQELNATAVRQVADILEEVEQTETNQKPTANQWFYSVPMAGVRYYSF